MEISMDMVKQLRDETGVSIMQCKKALEEAKGDREKALMALRKKSSEIAAKKSDRALGSGVVAAYVHANGSVGAMVELACETDFVAKNEDFKKLAYEIAMHIAAMNPEFRTDAEISDEAKKKAESFFAEEVAALKKPKEIADKVVAGKLESYFKEKVLLSQPFVKDPNITVGEMVKGAVQKFGENTEIARFTYFRLGGK
ncbi:MAG TPA: elongation factor Ts [Candidatus Paceibacterota bacterium]|nr:elongation factor Ts [Candidatus Paceibacterota bacterium]